MEAQGSVELYLFLGKIEALVRLAETGSISPEVAMKGVSAEMREALNAIGMKPIWERAER